MNADKPNRIAFNTDALPEQDRFPAFSEEYVRRYTGLDFVRRDKSGFRGTIELQRADAVDVGYVSLTPINSLRTPDLVRDGDDSLLVLLFESGAANHTQRRTNQKLVAGDAVICDCGYSGEVNIIDESRYWNLKVPRHRITALFPRTGRFAGARLDKDPVARRLLFGYLSGTQDVELNGDGRVTQFYGDHIIDLVALAFGADRETREFAEQRSVSAARRAAILHDIATHLHDPGLGAATIARRHGITPRYVHLLLEQSGQTFTQHVLQMRLERAAQLLGDDNYQNRKIADIALEMGFTDLSHFNRAFRRHFGNTPSVVRANNAKRRSSR
jgi:AraC-like DNA-binding protein